MSTVPSLPGVDSSTIVASFATNACATGTNLTANSGSAVWASQRPGPVPGQEVVAAAVVRAHHLAAGGAALIKKKRSGGGVERVRQDLGPPLPVARRVLETHGQRQELPEADPSAGGPPSNCWTCLGADPPAPVSNSPPPLINGTTDSILALVPTSRIGNRSVR